MNHIVASIGRRFAEFFHAPCDTRVLALLRIGFASLVLLHWFAMLPQLNDLWTDTGMLPAADLQAVARGFAPTLLSVLPRSNSVVWISYCLLGLHAACLLVGYRSRLNIVFLLIWLVSFQNRNPLVVNGQDALLRLIGFFLTFAPLGVRFAVGRAGSAPKCAPYYPLRFVQVQICIVMFAAGIWKLRGDDWTSGNALYYVTRLDGFWGNLPLPESVLGAETLRAMTFATLAIELSVPILIWIPKVRRAALGVALLFHAGLAYAMNLFLFEPIMALGWCSFLHSDDIDLVRRWFGGHVRPAPLEAVAKGECS